MVGLHTRTIRIVFILCILMYVYDQSACQGSEKNTPSGRVLVIGIDGVRPDALRIANTPAIDELISEGTFTDKHKNSW